VRRPAKKQRDPFELLASHESEVGVYQPRCGYLHADGRVSQYATQNMTWLTFDRAVSSCFGSAARRFRGTHTVDAPSSPIVAILMMVLSNGKIVWRHRVDIPEKV
jgi:hypothetical protein